MKHEDLQMRVAGLDKRHVRVLEQSYLAGDDLPAIKVAKVGKALYVLDGHHRLEAVDQAGLSHVWAEVAPMSLNQAKDFALLANTQHGKNLRPWDKARIFDAYVQRGKHLDAEGNVKPSRAIAVELNRVYSHETIRKKLKERGIELNTSLEFPGGYKPFQPEEYEEDDEATWAAYRVGEAHEYLHRFSSLLLSLEKEVQQQLLTTARTLLHRLERGERPERYLETLSSGVLDI
jgi:hypothetical protein